MSFFKPIKSLVAIERGSDGDDEITPRRIPSSADVALAERHFEENIHSTLPLADSDHCDEDAVVLQADVLPELNSRAQGEDKDGDTDLPQAFEDLEGGSDLPYADVEALEQQSPPLVANVDGITSEDDPRTTVSNERLQYLEDLLDKQRPIDVGEIELPEDKDLKGDRIYARLIEFLRLNGQDVDKLGLKGAKHPNLYVEEEYFRKDGNSDKAVKAGLRAEEAAGIFWKDLKTQAIRVGDREFLNHHKGRFQVGGQQAVGYRHLVRDLGMIVYISTRMGHASHRVQP